ncbi:ATPase [Planctomycetota bacterium]|nr:ATPase [Planctomycetota bacterium]
MNRDGDQPIRILDDVTPLAPLGEPWRVLIVDDNQDVLDLSHMVLTSVIFDRRPVTLAFARSYGEAVQVLEREGHQHFALAIIDVVMEHEHAGLRLVEHIRKVLGNRDMRLILRTGQPGYAPEETVIFEQDINDYRSKTDLRAQQLVTLVVAALRNFRDLRSLAEERARAERLAAEAESANRAKTEFLVLLSHELRTPLQGILGHAALLVEDLPADHAVGAQDILGCGRHLLGLVDDLLDMASLQTGHYPLAVEACGLKALLDEAIAPVHAPAERRGLALLVRLEPGLPERIQCDRRAVLRLLGALLGNAVKFSDRGTVELSARCAADPTAAVAARLQLVVRDQGPGLDQELRARLFKPFMVGDASARRRHGGLGLGLALAKGIAETMGGGLYAANRPGGGAELVVDLPLVDPGPIRSP